MMTHQLSEMNQPEADAAAEKTVSLLDILVMIKRNRRLISIITIAFVVLGIVVALILPKEYKSGARLIPEASAENSSPLSGGLSALRGLGFSLGGGAMGVSTETYPAILHSREVLLAVAKSRYRIERFTEPLDLVTYVSHERGLLARLFQGLNKITIGLPRTFSKAFGDNSEGALAVPSAASRTIVLTEEEEAAIKALAEMIRVSSDRATGIIGITVAAPTPLLAVQVANTLIANLRQRVRALYAEKGQKNLSFLKTRFEQAEQELVIAEDNLARFLDQNQDPQTTNLRTQMDRLARQVSFKEQLYRDLLTQRTQVELELQRSLPVITLLEAPVMPLRRSAPRRKLIVLASLLIGLVFGVVWVHFQESVKTLSRDPGDASKLAEIRSLFHLNLLATLRRLLRRSSG